MVAEIHHCTFNNRTVVQAKCSKNGICAAGMYDFWKATSVASTTLGIDDSLAAGLDYMKDNLGQR